MQTCPWSKYCLFPNERGKIPKDVNRAIFTVYSGPNGDHDPQHHSQWNSGPGGIDDCIFFKIKDLDLHPYKCAPPIFVKKSLPTFIEETKDHSLTQAIHQIEKEIVHSNMSHSKYIYGLLCSFILVIR